MFFWKDIYFRCPCCRKRLAVDRAAAGGEAPCPGCKASIRIPRRSGIPPKIVRRAGVVALNLAAAAALTLAGYLYVTRDAQPKPQPEPEHRLSPLEKALAEKRKTPPPGLAEAEARYAATAMDEMRTKAIELADRNARLQTQYDGMAKWVLDTYEGKFPLPLNLVSNLNLAAVSSNYTMGAEVEALLQVTPEEKTKVNNALEDALVAVTRQEMSRTDVAEVSEGRAKLVIGPYATEGARIKEELLGSLQQALGVPRAGKFADVTRQGLNEAFSYFGSAARELEFQVIPEDGNVPAYLLITDGYRLPDGDSLTRFNGKQIAVMELPNSYWAFIDTLPPAIRKFSNQPGARQF